MVYFLNMSHPANAMFQQRRLLIATMHGKEEVMASLLEKALGVVCVTPENFNSDSLGTFSGEVEREDDPLTTLRNKCKLAMEQFSCDLVVANEGSFGPHPVSMFLPADDELVMLMDAKNDLEIVARELSGATNFRGQEIKSEHELSDFAQRVHFPSHSIILRSGENDNRKIIKGIRDHATLSASFEELMQTYGSAFAETDMRAMHNPMRMKVIAAATEKLVAKIQSQCPQCHQPGFDVTDVQKGLRCLLCGLPTQSTLSYLSTCKKCSYTSEQKFPHGKTEEDPMYCSFCNP
jgi:hypothetical protein